MYTVDLLSFSDRPGCLYQAIKFTFLETEMPKPNILIKRVWRLRNCATYF